MASSELGLIVPAGTDAFDPQGDMVAMANSLKSRIVVPVANTTARTALLAAISWSPSAAEPLRVFRADAVAGLRWEEYDGSTWKIRGGVSYLADAGVQNWSTTAIAAGSGRNTTTAFNYTLPATPNILLTFINMPGGTENLIAKASGIGTTGFTMNIRNPAASTASPVSTYTVYWQAWL